MPSRTVKLVNAHGLHARPASVFAKAVSRFECDVVVIKDGREANAKSTLSILTLDCHQGDELTIRAEGPGAEEALVELVALIESGLGE